MSTSKRNTIACVAAGSCVLAWLSLGPWPGASAQATFPDPNANCPPAECGEVSPFIPMQSVEAVHMGLVWKTELAEPRRSSITRGFPSTSVNDMADSGLIDLAIARGALTTAGNQFNTSLRDVLHGFDPFLGLGHGSLRRRLVPAAHLRRLPDAAGSEPERADAHRRQPHDGTAAAVRHQSIRTRFKNTGKFHTALLDEKDFALNRAAFAGERLFEGHVLQHLLQRPRDAVRRTRLRVRRPRHAEQQRVVQGQYLRSGDRNLGTRGGAVHPSNWTQRSVRPGIVRRQSRTPRSIRTAIRETSRARNRRIRPIRSTRAGIRRRLRCRTTGARPRRLRPGRHRSAGSGPGSEGPKQPDPERRRVHREPREHRGAGSLRPEDRSEHRARERPDGLPALSTDGGRPDRAGEGRLEGLHVRRRDQLRRRSRTKTLRGRPAIGTRKASVRRAAPGSASAAARLPSPTGTPGAWTSSAR